MSARCLIAKSLLSGTLPLVFLVAAFMPAEDKAFPVDPVSVDTSQSERLIPA